MSDEVKLSMGDVFRHVSEVRDMLYKSISKQRSKKSFKLQRPSEQAMTEAQWQCQLAALDVAIGLINIVRAK